MVVTKEKPSNSCVWGSCHSKQETFWRRKWQPTPVFLPGKSHEQRSVEGSLSSRPDLATVHACTGNMLLAFIKRGVGVARCRKGEGKKWSIERQLTVFYQTVFELSFCLLISKSSYILKVHLGFNARKISANKIAFFLLNQENNLTYCFHVGFVS